MPKLFVVLKILFYKKRIGGKWAINLCQKNINPKKKPFHAFLNLKQHPYNYSFLHPFSFDVHKSAIEMSSEYDQWIKYLEVIEKVRDIRKIKKNLI